MANRISVFLLAAFCAAAQSSPELSNRTSDGRLAPQLKNLGNLHSPITTKSPDAQKFFNQGLTLVYAFNHAEALRSFQEVARLDPDCPMAYWGQALALAPNINDSAIGPDREQQGANAMQEAIRRRAKASPREQALIDALAARFAGKAQEDRSAFNAAYAKGMESAYKRFGKDPDVATLYADAVMNTRPWNYWTKDSKPQPGIAEVRSALEKTIKSHPNHAGARHMYIHLMEASDEVDRAIPSADRLGRLVPAAGHLVHMPGHVYIRVGRYADTVDANIKAIAADEDYITQCRAQGIYPAAYYPHNIHFLHAALMMEGRSADSLEAARKVASKHDHEVMKDPAFGFAHLLKALPALTMIRFGQWDAILQEPELGPDQKFESVMRNFARGFAFSAQGKPAEAAAELAQLEKAPSDADLKQAKIFDLNSLADLAAIATAMLQGEIASKAGKHDEAAAAFRKAAELEDNLLYSEPPDWPLPPRQYLAAVHLAAGNAVEAEKVYREDLKRHRANGWSLFGLEQALRKQNKNAEADRVHAQLQKAWTRSDTKLTASRF